MAGRGAGGPRQRPRLAIVRERELAQRIRERTHRIFRQPFVRIERSAPRLVIVRVPLYTDLEDSAFIEAFRATVERVWRVQDVTDDLRVALDVRRLTPAELYGPGPPPTPRQRIEVDRHVARFPVGGGILTTGANTTHVWGRAIVLGPHAIAPNVLAHEFGHILGIPDGYFRGYRDRGRDGYEVLEVVPDLGDIMSAPGFGRVGRHHFDLILGR